MYSVRSSRRNRSTSDRADGVILRARLRIDHYRATLQTLQTLGNVRVCLVTIGRIPKSDAALVGVAEEPAALSGGPLEPDPAGQSRTIANFRYLQ